MEMVQEERKPGEKKFSMLIRNNGLVIEPDFAYMIPKLDFVLKKDILSSGKKVNLHYLNCTCKIYRDAVKYTKPRDYRRVCKHIYRKLVDYYGDDIDDLTKLILDSNFWYDQKILFKIVKENKTAYVGVDADYSKQFVYIFKKKWKLISLEINSISDEVMDNSEMIKLIDGLVTKYKLP